MMSDSPNDNNPSYLVRYIIQMHYAPTFSPSFQAFFSSPNLFVTEHTSNSLLTAAHFAHSSELSLIQDFTASNCSKQELWMPLKTFAEQLSTASLSVVMFPG
mmetsp:Transcript_2100/g.4530  ORF Transcript_2100/g.4530 Transcript_2100/m.4530 type:complete len:102 (+) Transcript_2100:140-445(+)